MRSLGMYDDVLLQHFVVIECVVATGEHVNPVQRKIREEPPPELPEVRAVAEAPRRDGHEIASIAQEARRDLEERSVVVGGMKARVAKKRAIPRSGGNFPVGRIQDGDVGSRNVIGREQVTSDGCHTGREEIAQAEVDVESHTLSRAQSSAHR